MEYSLPIWLLVGILIGGLVVFFIFYLRTRTEEKTLTQMKDTFDALSAKALQGSMEQFLKMANETLRHHLEKGEGSLEEKKKLIDASIQEIRERIEHLSKQTSELKGQMEQSNIGVKELAESTVRLNQILSSSQARGLWGQRLVEDILDYMGLKRGINFDTQTIEGEGRPDFSFFLPKGKRVNMDVKFPWDHYVKLFEASSSEEVSSERKQFLKDVKNHIKTITKRDYINPAGGTVDFVLMFIPNEGIYAFLNKPEKGEENLVQFALDHKVLLCSPITLYAILGLIRQSVRSFEVETQAAHIQTLIQSISLQWQKLVDKIFALGKSLSTVQSHYDELSTTRLNQVDKPMRKIIELELDRSEDKIPQETDT